MLKVAWTRHVGMVEGEGNGHVWFSGEMPRTFSLFQLEGFLLLLPSSLFCTEGEYY